MSAEHFDPNTDEATQWLDDQRFELTLRPSQLHSVSPWSVVSRSFRGSRSEIVSATGKRIAMVYRARSRDESHSNARLLAAAPMLRDSLEILLSAVAMPDDETRAERDLRLGILDVAKIQATKALELASGETGGIEMVVREVGHIEDEADDLVLLPAPRYPD